MNIRPHHFTAFALSVSAHMALGFALGIGGGEAPRNAATEIVTVRLTHLNKAENSLAPLLLEHDNPADERRDRSTGLTESAVQTPEDQPILPILGQPEPRYFRVSELTEKPRILRDVSSDLALTLPDIPPQSAVLRLLINENGEIDRVVIEASALPEQAERLVIDAFSNIKFHPGRLGDQPVKSQMKIEVTLENFIKR